MQEGLPQPYLELLQDYDLANIEDAQRAANATLVAEGLLGTDYFGWVEDRKRDSRESCLDNHESVDQDNVLMDEERVADYNTESPVV